MEKLTLESFCSNGEKFTKFTNNGKFSTLFARYLGKRVAVLFTTIHTAKNNLSESFQV